MVPTFETWLDQLREKRRRWVEASHDNDFDRGIWNATVEKYADLTHFLFELLQNAEDTGATRGSFRLEVDAIVFEHNGRPFDRADIEGITGIGNTTKLEEANKIGCFGIGFKSVYAITERPEIHCTIEGAPIAFAIQNLVVPELIATLHVAPSTRIILPLPPAKAEETIARVRDALDTAGPRSLLFLQNLTLLEWSHGTRNARCDVHDTDGGVRTLRVTVDAQPARTERFVVCSRLVERDSDPRRHAVKIALRLNDGNDIVPEATTTRLAVFFETEDPTGLYFYVHGPFQLTDNRANIKRGDPWNTRLIGELATLVAESLPDLRTRGMMKRSFLEVMPNATDDIPEPWRPILASVVDAFGIYPLIPAHGGGHVTVSAAVRGPSEIRDLLGDEGLAVFGGLSERRWVGGGMRNTRADAFLATLKLTEWGWGEFLTAFQRAFAHSWYNSEIVASAKAQSWFDALPDDQVQRFYLLVDAAIRAQKRSVPFAQLAFVRLEDGKRVKPGAALLSPADGALDEEAAAHGLVLVRSALTRTGRTRGKEVEQFLRKVGVKEISERDYLAAIVRANYAVGVCSPTSERHQQHMRRFLRWFAHSGDCKLFEEVAFLRAEGIDGYHEADAIYLDAPFAQSGLSRIYGGRVKGRNRRPLWSGYNKLKRQDLLALLKALGVEEALRVESTRIPYSHPKWNELFNGFSGSRTTSTQTNSDFTILGLSCLLALGDSEISKMIWKAVAAVGVRCMYAHHAPNQAHDPRRELSTLALGLQKAAWIPAKDGSLRRPSAMTASELAAGFSTAGNDAWLNVIDFAADHRQRSEQYQARRRAAQSIGLPAELADQLGLLSPESLKTLGSEMLQRIASGAFTPPEFPEREAPNPERRAERLAERARAAPIKAYESRARSVRTTDREARQQARPYLRDFYTNPAGDMICQACQRIMPFRLADGTPYFEAPELLLSASAELAENHLALCPTCCAKWQHANSTSEAEIGAAIRSAESPELWVTLAGVATRVRFVQVHFDDLRTIFDVVMQNMHGAKTPFDTPLTAGDPVEALKAPA